MKKVDNISEERFRRNVVWAFAVVGVALLCEAFVITGLWYGAQPVAAPPTASTASEREH